MVYSHLCCDAVLQVDSVYKNVTCFKAHLRPTHDFKVSVYTYLSTYACTTEFFHTTHTYRTAKSSTIILLKYIRSFIALGLDKS